jgi:hypothetical protein
MFFKNKKYTFFFVFFALFSLFACSNEDKKNKEQISKKDALVEVAKEVQLLYSDSAVVRIKVTGPKLLSHIDKENPYDEFSEGVKMDFFDALQQPSSILTGKYALRYPLKNQVIIRDSCVWQSLGSQEKLEAFELIWDENLQKVYSNKLVIITTPTEKIWGYGFETNQDFTRWKINKPQGRLAVEKIQ